jgi:hypothetical protein
MNLLLVAATVFELQLPILCGPTDNMLQGIKDRYGESPVFISPSKNDLDEDLTHSFWLNIHTETWSFIVSNKQKNTTCVISSGQKFELLQQKGTPI